jgi:hypothetical protein
MGDNKDWEGGYQGGPHQTSCNVYNDTDIAVTFMLTSSQTIQLISNVNKCLVV